MSNEMMAKCLEDSAELWAAFVVAHRQDKKLHHIQVSDVVPLAVALYHERCEDARLQGEKDLWDSTLAGVVEGVGGVSTNPANDPYSPYYELPKANSGFFNIPGD